MRLFQNKWRWLARIMGVLLIATGSYFGYWWYYKFAPIRHTLEPGWVANHSRQVYWHEVQTGIHRGIWHHDNGWDVGLYGDKTWAEWIMAHVKPDTSMDCLAYYSHSALSMQYITNQDVGSDADPWLNWWQRNKSKSQIEWIADGFAQRGFKVSVPPTIGQIPTLLAILASSESKCLDSPKPLTYNAFRCLRDTGFEPIEFVLSHPTVSDELKRGLLHYGKLYQHFPGEIGIGLLSSPTDDANKYWKRPVWALPEYQASVPLRAFGPIVIGAIFLIWSFRKKKMQASQKAAGVEPTTDHTSAPSPATSPRRSAES